MESERDNLSAVQLGRLLPILPSVLGLLKEANPMAADLFLEGKNADPKLVNYVSSDLLNTLNFNGDLSMIELRFAFVSYKIEVWLGLVRNTVVNCWPRLIPDKVAVSLLGSLSQLNEANTAIECGHILGPLLDRIPRTRFRVLAEFASFIRDTSSSPEDLATLTGPFLLLPSNTVTTQGTSLIASQTAASAAIMDMLISEAELLFGRVALAAPYGYPLGKRAKPKGGGLRTSLSQGMRRLSMSNGKKKNGKPPAPPMRRRGGGGLQAPPGLPARPGMGGGGGGGGGGSPMGDGKKSTLLEKRKQGLRVFYQWRDPRRGDRVDVLFASYEFEEIALAIQRKYYALPPGWKEQLQYMLISGNPNLGWFSRLQSGILPAPIDVPGGGLGGGGGGGRGHEQQVETKIDKIINEIADTEQHFNATLKETFSSYVNKIKSISEGLQGSAQQKALGLTPQAVEFVFGSRLEKLVDVSDNLLSDLEVVTLVRMQPKAGASRIELISRVFAENSQAIYASFSPFACTHRAAITMLREANQGLNGGQNGGLRRMGSFLGDKRQKNYLELWHEVTSGSEFLQGQTLESVLIMPIQRVPRYKLLLEELKKATPPDDKCYTQLLESVTVIKNLATDINEAIRQHERLMKKFGDDIPAQGMLQTRPPGF